MRIESVSFTGKMFSYNDTGWVDFNHSDNKPFTKEIINKLDTNYLYEVSSLINNYLLTDIYKAPSEGDETENRVKDIIKVIKHNYNFTKLLYKDIKDKYNCIENFKDIPVRFYRLIAYMQKILYDIHNNIKPIYTIDNNLCTFSNKEVDKKLKYIKIVKADLIHELGVLCSKYLKWALDTKLLDVSLINIYKNNNKIDYELVSFFTYEFDSIDDYDPTC